MPGDPWHRFWHVSYYLEENPYDCLEQDPNVYEPDKNCIFGGYYVNMGDDNWRDDMWGDEPSNDEPPPEWWDQQAKEKGIDGFYGNTITTH